MIKNSITFALYLAISILFVQCTAEQGNTVDAKNKADQAAIDSDKNDRIDHHSFAQPEKAKAIHLNLDLNVDFQKRMLLGKASYQIENNQADAIVFDTRDLTILRTTIGNEEAETTHELAGVTEHLGQALTINIKPETKLVHIYYSTKPDGAVALDWLEPQQTAGKKHPFLFTQGQAILTRSWIPCQDSPGIRITYDAKVKVPKELMAVMSSSNPQKKNDTGAYDFKMKQAIPPYLIALAVGDLEFGDVGKRTGVYAEPSLLKKSLYEFEDMEKMLVVAEGLYGPYLWERYDVIVLPPSFPFGGMENPRLTFATPTIIAGDKSLTSLIAHELAHSWSGNLVTNATWNDFWLNEGFTVYFEKRIMEAVYGEDYVNMLAVLGYQDLEEDVDLIGHRHADTHLKLNLKGRDPDDGMTDIAYEKGAFFLQMIEEKVGREKFDDFIKNYFDTHKFQTITTNEFVAYLKKNIIEKYNVDIDYEEWIFGPGIPKNCPPVQSEKFAVVDEQIKAVASGSAITTLLPTTSKWTTHEWLHFIRHLPKDLDLKTMSSIDKAFNFTNSGNNEILHAWYVLSVQNGYSSKIIDKIETFLVGVGRRKFLTPLYRAFKEKGDLATAQAIYKKARPYYHAVSRNTMDALLEL